jgi:transcription-repair coupling factor (superfamily II helicase)
MREHYRGGQSFYVCPRIEDLLGERRRGIARAGAGGQAVTAHGRMAPTSSTTS